MLREVVDAALEWGGTTVGVVDSESYRTEEQPRVLPPPDQPRPDPSFSMTSTSASTVPSHRPEAVKRAAVTGNREAIGSALARLANVARETGVELLIDPEEAEKHGLEPADGDADIGLVVVLGGDGTMLRALARYLGTGIPVLGVNFGRIGFLTSIEQDELEAGLGRVFSGDYSVVELPTLDVEVGSERRVALNDLVVTSGVLGRMILLEWSVQARRSGGSAVTASSARRRRARQATTSRTAAPCSSGAWMRWRSPSSHRTRSTRARSSSPRVRS